MKTFLTLLMHALQLLIFSQPNTCDGSQLTRRKKGTLYLSTTSSPTSTSTLQSALSRLLSTFGSKALYTLSCTQSQGSRGLQTKGETLTLPSPRTSLSFDDEMLGAVREAWEALWERWGGERGEFMVFEDREGADDDDEV